PQRVVLRPRVAWCDQITLAYIDWPLVQHFLGDIQFSWTKPQRMQLEDLQRAFGPLRIVPTYDKVSGPDTYCFEIRRQPLHGVVLVEATPERRGETLLVESLTLRRLAPDPYSLEEGRAVRLVVFAAFGATRSLSNVTPLPSNLWKHAGLSDLLSV